MRYIVPCFIVMFVSITAVAKDTVPCQQKCSIAYGTKWTECNGIKECQSFVDSEFHSCVKACDATKAKR